MLVYLDTSAIQRPLDDRTVVRNRIEGEAMLALIAAVEAGQLTLASSDVLRFETENAPVPARRDFARRVLALATADTATTDVIEARAVAYVTAGLAPLDAVHLASAVGSRPTSSARPTTRSGDAPRARTPAPAASSHRPNLSP